MVRYHRKPKPFNMNDSGLPVMGEPEFLAVGRLRKSHGLDGEMTMDVLTDFPERLEKGKVVLVGESRREMTFHSIRPKNKEVLVSFVGITDPEMANTLRNAYVYVRVDEIPKLPEGEFYFHQLLGMKVVDAHGDGLGTLVEILETGANDVYVIKNEIDNTEILLPAVDEFVLRVDLELKVMVVSPPEWQ